MSDTFDITKYRNGYSIGVGGVVLCNRKVLLVRSALGRSRGDWSIPGGFVEREETIDIAIKREIYEEANVQAEIEGLIAARNRVTGQENSAYFVFLLHAPTEEAQADGIEVDEAQYFALSEVLALQQLNALSRLIIAKLLEDKVNVLTFQVHPTISANEYVLFI